MRTLGPSLRALALGALVATAGCGDDGGTPVTPDAAVDAPIDAPPTATFTSFVLDLVTNQTTATGEARPFEDFSTLPDPDQDNPNAYEALFP